MNSVEYHRQLKGKIEVISRAKINSREDLRLAYTPGVAKACEEIAARPEAVYELTRKHNLVAVITDGSAVLGLGDIGPAAGLPVMEGKCILFKEFGGVDAFPIALATQDVDEIVRTIEIIAPMFGGINLEDIAAPRCFEVEQRLIERLDIPVFHDDQHGTAIVVVAALYNALKVVNKKIEDIIVVVNGVGAAGTAITKLLLEAGVEKLRLVDSKGIIYDGRGDLDAVKKELASITNTQKLTGGLAEAVAGADVFVGVSKPGVLTPEMVRTMNAGAIVLAMANPTPEIMPELARAAGAAVVATGRSDFPNQVNNALVFPGLFRGLLDKRIQRITTEMKLRAARALAEYVTDVSTENILPSLLDKRVVAVVAASIY